MDQADITASPKLRAIFGAVAAFMLALWGWSLIPPIENWDNPYEDGFSYVAVFYATITCLRSDFICSLRQSAAADATSRTPARRRAAFSRGGVPDHSAHR